MKKPVFLPYQNAWLEDKSRFKIWQKSRRIGATWVQAYEDVEDCLTKAVPAVWFSSADESAAKEYIRYCANWAKLFNAAFKEFDNVIVDEQSGIKSLMIEFANGTRIHALSSNPTAFRSKGGKLVIDEFAFHKNDVALWAAAKPIVTWGYPVRIISTHNGKGTLYYKFIEQIEKAQLEWSLHTVAIQDAVQQGLVDKIFKRHTTQSEREYWLKQEREACASTEIWEQEYCCNPIDESTAFLPYTLIDSCRRKLELNDYINITNPLYIGFDAGRRGDFSILWGLEDTGERLETVIYIELHKMKFSAQEEIIYEVLNHPKLVRACFDETGLGMQLAERAQERYGTSRIECVYFTAKVKDALAHDIRARMEDSLLLIPDDEQIRKDFHAVQKTTTAAGNIRFDAKRTQDGHADRFWAAALAIHAHKTPEISIPSVRSRQERRKSVLSDFGIGGLRGY
jgi:phage FluMu gp28-like protein